MAWLVQDNNVMASVEVAVTRSSRRRGLMGRTEHQGALLLAPARWIHTARMRFAIDVAYLRQPAGEASADNQLRRLLDGSDATFDVASVATYRPWRLGRPRLTCCAVLEATAGSFARWGLSVDSEVQVRAAGPADDSAGTADDAPTHPSAGSAEEA